MRKMFHLNTKIFGRGKGHTFQQSKSYRDGGKATDLHTGKNVNYQWKIERDGIETHYFPPAGASEKLQDRDEYYKALEQKEKAKNAQYFREFEIAFPNDIPLDSRREIGIEFSKYLQSQGMFVDMNIHKLDSNNPHAHILTSLRSANENGELGNKNREWNDRKKVYEWREKFAEITNNKYKELGIDNYVSEKSYHREKVDKVAMKKLPKNKKSKEYKERFLLNKEINVYNSKRQINKLQTDRNYLNKEIIKRYEKKQKSPKLVEAKIEIKKDLLQEKMNLKKAKSFIKLNQTLQNSKVKETKKAKDRGLSL